MSTERLHDLAVIGAGPCGLAVAVAAKTAGLDYVILDRGCVTNSLIEYPYYLTFFSTAERLEIGNVPFTIPEPKPTRREALAYYRKVVQHHDLVVNQYEEVVGIDGGEGEFVLTTRPRYREERTLRARAIVAATGGFHEPNYLGCPGEELAKVLHYYREPYPFFDQDVLVVGGGNSAVESALELHRNGARVQMVHFAEKFDRGVKPWVVPDIVNRTDSGDIPMHWSTRVSSIEPHAVELRNESDGTTQRIANDWVLAMTGWRVDRTFLGRLGVSVDEETGIPTHDRTTMETDVPGLYIAGVIAAGHNANKIFIENGREHGGLIVAHLAANPPTA